MRRLRYVVLSAFLAVVSFSCLAQVAQSEATPSFNAEWGAAAKTEPGIGLKAIEPKLVEPEPRLDVETKKIQPPVLRAKPKELSEFQQMIADSVGKVLRIYGSELFDEAPSTFAPVDRAPVPADYVIGPGDELLIRLWGPLNLDERITVDRNGQIFLPRVGEITVAGTRYSNLTTRIRDEISRSFRNFELSVSLGRLRSIDIFVVGRASRPGKYTVSSLSTLVNALFASGGPAPEGSLRHLQVKRDGKLVADFDLYELLLKGDRSKDVRLLPGDVIYIPPVGSQVALAGSVNLPAIFELKDPESTIAEVIELSGGLTVLADSSRAFIERIDNHQFRTVHDLPLDAAGLKQPVKNGDLVRVMAIVPRFQNAVTLRGNVANPGRYPWTPGMRILDLIPGKEMLLTREFWSSQNSVVDARSTQYKASSSSASQIIEEKQQGGKVPESSSKTGDLANKTKINVAQDELQQDVKLNAPEINWDYAVVQRLNTVDLSTKLIPFSPAKVILERNGSENLELNPGDIVTFFSQRDISVPQNRKTKFVRVEGEVNAPGIYRVEEGENLRSLIARAGGLGSHAYLYATQFTRQSAQKEQQEALQELVRTMESELQQSTVAQTRSRPEETAAINARSEAQQRLLEQLRNTRASGRVVLGLRASDYTAEALPPLLLEDGDKVIVPQQTSTVSVVGAVFKQSSFLFRPGATVGDYLNEAGRGTRNADMKKIHLIRADGSIVGRAQISMFRGGFKSIRVQPGDTIVIPNKFDAGGAFTRALRDWTQLASQLALTAASISVVSR